MAAPEPDTPEASRLLFDDVTDLPLVPLLLGKMQRILGKSGQLGLLTIHIAQDMPVEHTFSSRAFDGVLRDVAGFLAEFKEKSLRREDDVSDMMVSGNAFVILVSPPRGNTKLERTNLEQLRNRLREPLRQFVSRRVPDQFSDRFGCHVGCALIEHDPNQRPERQIYQALDRAKADSLRSKDEDRQSRSDTLQQILRERGVRPVYQPVVDLVRREVIGFEALSRVTAGLFRNVEQMFRVAQEANATWELERLCREKAIHGVGEFPRGKLLFLNVEPDSVYDPQFRGPRILELLREAGLVPQNVVLEITEHSSVQDFRAFRETLKHFRSQGFLLAIDDVGSAYSGLQSIAEVRPDFIKIDMSLTRDLHRNRIKRDLIHTINRFSISSGISLIAEGVETVEELRELHRIGVVLAQGYLFARPEHPFPKAQLEFLDPK